MTIEMSSAHNPNKSFQRAETNGSRWYVVQTRAHGENRALINLHRQDYHVFCPRLRRIVRHGRVSKSALAPLFPGYLFVRLDASWDQWRAINGTFGVIRLIVQGDAPQAIPSGVVEALQLRADENGIVDLAPVLTPGQAVRVAEGPFADFVGTLEHLDCQGRVRVLLELLGRSVSVSLWREALIPAA
jgi:transcriptional antiterminator RfaH